MEVIIENLISYILIIVIIVFVFFFYLKRLKKKSETNKEKIQKAIELGFHEPVTLHPVVNTDTCIGSGACVRACPEQDILGIVDGQVKVINASRCVGHGACFHACPVQAITLCIGTEKRGVELPHISPQFESNIPGIFIAGELGGMGLIKNAVEQGKQAVENISKKIVKSDKTDYDLIIVGAGPAGISASLTAAKYNIRYLTLEQDYLGGTVFHFPRAKIIMTSPMELPLWGKVKLSQTSKSELLSLWEKVLAKNRIVIKEREKVETIEKKIGYFEIKTNHRIYKSAAVLLAIGRRGSPRKLNVPGEEKEKVYYRLLEPELIHEKNILIVGGGDSAVESALLLAEENNNVIISYRGETFSRLKPKNHERVNTALYSGKIKVLYNSNVKEIKDKSVLVSAGKQEKEVDNDLVYIFAGGILPTNFLEKTGIKITKKFGEAILTHKKSG